VERRKEETLAAALWSFIQRLRETEDPLAAGLDGLTPADAAELAVLFRTAEDLRRALDAPAEVSVGTAAERVRAAIARRQVQGRRAPGRRAPWWQRGMPIRTARYGWAVAVAAALAVGVVAGRQLPASDPLTHPPAAVAALTHAQTCARVPLLIAGRLSASESRAVLWHLSHCEECFAAYRHMLGSLQGQSRLPAAVQVTALPRETTDRTMRW
jgi:hypothetical protein